jgi:hypothetical protein
MITSLDYMKGVQEKVVKQIVLTVKDEYLSPTTVLQGPLM